MKIEIIRKRHFVDKQNDWNILPTNIDLNLREKFLKIRLLYVVLVSKGKCIKAYQSFSTQPNDI